MLRKYDLLQANDSILFSDDILYFECILFGAIQVLRNADGGGVSDFPEKSVTRGWVGDWGSNFQKKALRNT